MKTLVLTVGLPRSGKSTWAKKFAATCGGLNAAIVNPDSIRLALYEKPFIRKMEPLVWFLTRVMVRALFEAGHGLVILDATNLTKELRDTWLSEDWVTRYKVFDASVVTCAKRAEQDDREDLIPIIENMSSRFEPLHKEEKLRELPLPLMQGTK